jgi:hypothetical protein
MTHEVHILALKHPKRKKCTIFVGEVATESDNDRQVKQKNICCVQIEI